MYKNIFLAILLFIPLSLFARSKMEESIVKLRKTKKVSQVECEAVIEEVVSHGLDIVPLLIEEITNRKKTAPDTLWAVAGNFTVGDLALCCINEIINLPVFDLAGLLPQKSVPYYKPVWDDLHTGRSNRKGFQEELRQWYVQNRESLEWYPHLRDGRGLYMAPKPVYEPCDEDIIVDYLLYKTDRNSNAKYLIENRQTYFHDFSLRISEWDKTYLMDPELENHLTKILYEMKEYAEANSDEDKWNAQAPILQQRRFEKFKIIPDKESTRYLFGTDKYEAGTVYRISKPFYDKSGKYCMVSVSWSPARGGHGHGSIRYILEKTDRGWRIYKTGGRIMS